MRRAVLILNTFNEGPEVERTIRSWQEHSGDCQVDAVVVADGTTDGSCDDLGEDVTVIKPITPVGIGQAKSIALRHVDTLGYDKDTVIFHADAHCRFLKGTVAEVVDIAVQNRCIVTPAVGPLRCAKTNTCSRHGNPATCTVDCPDIEDNVDVPRNCYYGGDIVWKDGLAAEWTLHVPGHPVERTLAVNPAIFAYSLETLRHFGGWNRYPGRWGSQELGLSLRAWFSDTPIMVARDVVCLHRYRSWNQPKALAPYDVEDGDRGANSRYAVAVVSSTDLWDGFWRGWFASRHPSAAADEKFAASEIEQQTEDFAAHKVKSDREFWKDVVRRPFPLDWRVYGGACRALYVIGAGIGNALMTVPAQRALASMQDDGKIDILDAGLHQGAGARELFERQPWVRSVFTEEPDLAEYARIVGSYWSAPPSFTPAGCIVGQAQRAWRTRHEVECNMDAVRSVGFSGVTPPATLGSWDMVSLPVVEPYVAVGVGCAGYTSKKYPHWRIVSELLHEQGVQLVFVGGEKDDEAFMDRLGTNLLGQPFVQTAGVIWAASLYVGIDNGLSHLAAATRTPSLLLYGPSSERKNVPWGIAHEVIRSGSCASAPCWDHPSAKSCKFEREDCRPCMEAIPPSLVASRALALLNRPAWEAGATGPLYLSKKQDAVNKGLIVQQDHDEFTALIDILRRQPIVNVAEIGAGGGAWFHILANALGCRLFIVAIDPCPLRKAGRDILDEAAAFAHAVEDLRGHGHKVFHISAPSLESGEDLEAILEGRQLDLVHIDGDHSAGAPEADLALVFPYVRPGGFVVFHDVANTRESGTGDLLEMVEGDKEKWEMVHRIVKPGKKHGILCARKRRA